MSAAEARPTPSKRHEAFPRASGRSSPDVGKTIVAHSASERALIIMMQQDNTRNVSFDSIRDNLYGLNVNNAVILASSSSASLMSAGKVTATPARYKNNTIPYGFGFRIG